MIHARGQAHPGQRLPGLQLRIGALRKFEWQQHVLQRRQRGDEVEGLEHEADALRPQPRPPSSLRVVRSTPSSHRWPVVGRSSPASIASRVDLPAPEAPVIATVSPRAMSNETSCTMASGPSGLLTCLVRLTTLRTLGSFARCGALALTLLLIGLQGAAAAQNQIMLSFGDSLSAAYGLQPEQGWVALLQQRLRTQGYEYQVINASVSGETSSGGLQRLPTCLPSTIRPSYCSNWAPMTACAGCRCRRFTTTLRE